MFIKNHMICELSASSNNTSVGRVGKGGKGGDLFTDGFSNSDALKLLLQSQTLARGRRGEDASQRYSVGSTEPMLRLPSGSFGLNMPMNMEMEVLTYYQGNPHPPMTTRDQGCCYTQQSREKWGWSPGDSLGHLCPLLYPTVTEKQLQQYNLTPQKSKSGYLLRKAIRLMKY